MVEDNTFQQLSDGSMIECWGGGGPTTLMYINSRTFTPNSGRHVPQCTKMFENMYNKNMRQFGVAHEI